MTKLIILRGLPGSGKSTLAHELLNGYTAMTSHLCSADHYFTRDTGEYNFNAKELPLAHLQCRYNCEVAMIKKTGLIIIDNPNHLVKYMKPYMRMAQYYKYDVEIIKVNTAWSNNPVECHDKCTHDVPLNTIKRMALQFEHFELGD